MSSHGDNNKNTKYCNSQQSKSKTNSQCTSRCWAQAASHNERAYTLVFQKDPVRSFFFAEQICEYFLTTFSLAENLMIKFKLNFNT